MRVSEALKNRVSVRAFKSDPVRAETVRAILELARASPSGGNLQPWHVFALSGESLLTFKTMVAQAMLEAPEAMEYEIYPGNLWEPYRSRRFECGEDLYATIGISREDKLRRLSQVARNFDFFGAPVGLFFFIDRGLGPPQWADIGMYMQSVMLLAQEYGLDTCPQEAWARFPATTRSFVKAPHNQMLFAGMALGYRDESHAINTLRTKRADPSEFLDMTRFE
jgi:nitroreductase